MVFGLFESRDTKLTEERENQEHVIEEELKSMHLDHELQRQKITQKGLIAQQQLQHQKEEEQAKQQTQGRGRQVAAKQSPNDEESKPGPHRKLMQNIEMARKGYEQLVHAIVRPPRAQYKMQHLGPSEFTFLDQRFSRSDTTLMTERGLRLECSHWEPVSKVECDTVIIYMHGNASARVEVVSQLSYMLSLGASVFSFDFAGSGMSDGDYVSLGYYEREDLESVVAHLRATMGPDTRIALWGRSMGAATALMYAERDDRISCMILDSSFCSLVKLAEEMVDKAREQGIGVPNVVVSVALAAIGWSVQQKAQFDIKHISPMAHAANIDVPALFVCGAQDDFIKQHHSEIICERYKGRKNLLLVPGDHNDARPPIMFLAATQFFTKHLELEEDGGLNVPEGLNLQTAPWQHRQNRSIFQAHAISDLKKTAADTTETVALDSNEIGMTKERQDEIQSRLVQMLGQEEKAAEISPRAAAGNQEGEETILEEHA